MARFRDWLDLGKSTVTSLKGSDVTNLYVVEWPETKKMLIADHSASIDGEPRRVRRWIRTVSAIMYGLAKRLAPHRRVLFAASFIAFFVCLLSLYLKMRRPPLWTFVEVAAAFVMLTALLAMELIDKIRFRDELELARDLQAHLIPAHPAQSEHFEIAAFNLIANTVGGDIYDFVPLEDGRMAVLFGDASGHGMAAGLVMAVAHAAFRTQLDIDPAPASIISSLNRILCRTGGSRSFFSCCYVLLSPDGTFTGTIAGHPQVLKVDRGGKVVDHIGRGSYPLGVKSGMVWDELSGTLTSGERLVFHSDGLTEARNPNGREFGESYVEAILGWSPAATAAAVVETLLAEWQLFTARRPPEDDVSVAVVVKR
ncbi:MAG: phosphoserine phosphatase RsbU/P [Acidobacteriota bacterium]|nr:phosphoserine phosphatase RsbU/P [Acidobacteriota bacterium]